MHFCISVLNSIIQKQMANVRKLMPARRGRRDYIKFAVKFTIRFTVKFAHGSEQKSIWVYCDMYLNVCK